MAAARSRTSPTDDSGKLREMPRMARGGRLAASLQVESLGSATSLDQALCGLYP